MLPTPPMPPNPYFMQRIPHNMHGQPLMHPVPPSFGPVMNPRDHSDESRTPLDRPKEHRSKELHRDSQHKSTPRNHRNENSRPKSLSNEHSKPKTDSSHKSEHSRSDS